MFPIVEEQTFEDGQVIWGEGSFGDSIYVLVSGAVMLSKMIRGESVAIDVLRPEEIFGEIGYITKSSQTLTAQAIGSTTLGIVDRDFLDQEYNRIPEIFKIILKNFLLRLGKASENANFDRKSPRVPRGLSLIFRSREHLIKAFTTNVSAGGLFIKTPAPLVKGECFSIELRLPEDPEPLKIECEVAWSRIGTYDPVREPVGMGVKFIEISSTDQQRLETELKRTGPG